MTVSGHETYELVLAQLAALRAEPPKSEAHAEAIAASIAIFEREAKEMESVMAAQLEKEYEARFGRARGQAQNRGYGRYVAEIAAAADAVAAKEAKPKKRRAKKQTA